MLPNNKAYSEGAFMAWKKLICSATLMNYAKALTDGVARRCYLIIY